ncbi:MAG: tetratricopeptide repeat protein, partial [Hyphomicrobiales bacterium]|nr:tetratricopeptide repeat protein [Hyphomicrobiales bacterium]
MVAGGTDSTAVLRAAIAHHQAGSLEKARGLYEEALRSNPGDHAALHGLGVLLCSTGHVEAGVRHIRNAIQIFPNFLDAHYNLGVVFQRHGQFAAALAHFDQALALAPGHFGAVISRASALRSLGRHGRGGHEFAGRFARRNRAPSG